MNSIVDFRILLNANAEMTLSELLPPIHLLPREDKLRLIQLLAEDVARDDSIVVDVAHKTVPIWSPYESFHGAATLLRVLEDEEAHA